MKKLVISAALGFMIPLMSLGQSTLGPGVITTSLTMPGSPHNFSGQAWNPSVSSGTVYVSGNQICQPCHTPHNAQTSVSPGTAPLWNHQFTTATYNMYISLDAGTTLAAAPDGTSRLCLSCHDGSVALGSFGGQTGTIFINAGVPGAANLGTDLTNDHPISMVYDTSLAHGWGGLQPLTYLYSTYTSPGVYTPQTRALSTKLDINHKVQCTSCHGAHANSRGYQLGMSNEGSALCLVCHKK
ncbi:MAG: cytochrome c3 family protein [Bacteroidia bacterium]